MLSGSKTEVGPQNLSPGLRMTIETLKEVAKGHSEADIYATLKESNMDPNETFQKLYHQDTFHEVRRRRDRRKEVVNAPRVHVESTGYKIQEDRKEFEPTNVAVKSNTYLNRNIRRAPYKRNALPGTGVNREFRVVRDNRINHHPDKETLNPAQGSFHSEPAIPTSTSPKESSNNKVSGEGNPHASIELTSSHPLPQKDANISPTNGLHRERNSSVSKPHSTTSSSNSILGVYSSSMDPVHVPSHGSRSAAHVGAIKRDVGVVGARRPPMESSANKPSSSSQGGVFPNSHAGQQRPSSRGTPRSYGAFSKSDQNAASVSSSHPNGRPFTSYQQNPRPHQSVVHQKSAQLNKEWKPKLSQKSGVNASQSNEKAAKPASPVNDRSIQLEEETSKLQDNVSRVNISENVIIAPHLRVSESDKYRLTFGSLDAQFVSSNISVKEHHIVPSESLPVSVSGPSSEEAGADNKQLVLGEEDHPQDSGSSSPVQVAISDPPQIDKKESSAPHEMDNYTDVRLVRDTSTSFESRRQQDASDLPSFSVYDPQTGYDLSYFRPNTADEAVRGHGLLSPQEALSSHAGISIPPSSIGMIQQAQQQQQQAVAQMYPQVHLPHFTSMMPYRQFISPVYVPPMAVQGYSGNPAYSHHPTNGSSYVLMPGGSSHLSASGGLKYGMQQFKPLPTGSQTGFGSFASPTGYAMNAPGVIGSATGLDESTRLKYKDGNLYLPNPQAETTEIWMNAREVPNMQAGSFFNMPAVQTPHAGPTAYMPSHGGHPSFNTAVVAQSSHMQFPMYHQPPPQAAPIANPHHHMGGGAMGGNVGVGMAAAAPGGAYQQPQLGHLNWTIGNF
ncbi:unnamed protein product [Cuscuta epithymum]|uniref:GBF-interacting protein 1 N-terminal domain-containing protein n=1 Tax=Cuscuta epithymum TaxID=186058 RepID=A0AAV0F3S9_9ASTE|nr:unnamed protein product [Cuscuta epithymum]CAH9130177.1 unnamed protein product [Cuscuta epithymum]